jgi:hypothetical protein
LSQRGALGVTNWSLANCRLPPSRLVLFRVSFCYLLGLVQAAKLCGDLFQRIP